MFLPWLFLKRILTEAVKREGLGHLVCIRNLLRNALVGVRVSEELKRVSCHEERG